MLKFGVIVLLTVYLPSSVAKTCTACKHDFDTVIANASKPEKCSTLATYLTCLEGSGKDAAGCPPLKADAEAIDTDFTDASCKTAFTDTCICQKDFWKTDQKTGGVTAVCSASKVYIACLKGTTSKTCDNTKTVVALATGVASRITSLGSKVCVSAFTSTCLCEMNATKADISADDKTVLTDLKTCLSKITNTTEAGCSSITQAALVTATDNKITAAKCGSFADHVTYTMTSLIVPVFVHLFM